MNRRDLLKAGTAVPLAGLAAAGSTVLANAHEAALPPEFGPNMDIFDDTIAKMTYVDIEKATEKGAVALWAIAVIEQHGPHLPTGTDVFRPSAYLRQVKSRLAEDGIEALIVPPFYWGVNQVSGAFPGSYSLRPEIMKEAMADIFAGMKTDGFEHVFCISGHGDALHNETIAEGIALGRERTGLDISFVLGESLAGRIDLDPKSPAVATYPDPKGPEVEFIDVHAGRGEVSEMLVLEPKLVRQSMLPELKSTDYKIEDLMEWRKGLDAARAKTPNGYFGDPASGNFSEGSAALEGKIGGVVNAIKAHLDA